MAVPSDSLARGYELVEFPLERWSVCDRGLTINRLGVSTSGINPQCVAGYLNYSLKWSSLELAKLNAGVGNKRPIFSLSWRESSERALKAWSSKFIPREL